MRGSAGPTETARALRRTRDLGPYFTVQLPVTLPRQRPTGPERDVTDLPGWQRFSGLLDDPDQLHAAVEVTRAQLGADERVAASMWSLGWAARLLSPLMGSLVTSGVLPLLTPDRLWWRPAVPGPVRLAAHSPSGLRLPVEDVTVAERQLYAVGVEGLLAPLLTATGSAYGLPEHVLWGNAASALVGAADAVSRALPTRAPVVRAVAAGLLGIGELRRRGGFRSDGGFVRRSCCLAYRVAPGALCGDCVLADRSRTGSP
jgi:ferric iron reductase protein FhuF